MPALLLARGRRWRLPRLRWSGRGPSSEPAAATMPPAPLWVDRSWLSEALEIVFAGLQMPLLKLAPFALPGLWAGLRLFGVWHEACIGWAMEEL